MSESLNTLLGDLHAERVRTWDPIKLQINIDQRRELVVYFDSSRTIQRNDEIPPFTLLDVDGGTITRDELIADGPAVLIFFRFAGCPACNIALPYYERNLQPHLQAAGVPLVAVSPQVPNRLIEIKRQHALKFAVASDPGNTLARRLGITYEANKTTRQASQGEGWIGQLVGTGTWELPQPTVLIIGSDARVRFVDISPDWLVRTEAKDILQVLAEDIAQPALSHSDAYDRL